ncbi:MAG: nickel transporter [Aquabacterium sp.]|jgi:high-affinity nickel-transport protein|nr:nickel transporter [Aquabacterium sp.]
METLPANALSLYLLVFTLGLKHGLDADHLATIDGLTRYNSARGNRAARWCGVLFSLGHGAVVLAIAVGVSLLAQGWAVPAWAEDLGTWISIGFLTLLGIVNLRSVWATPAGEVVQPVGLKGRWLAGLQRASHPVLIAAVGAMFALSFDTLSQAALFAATGASHGGVGHALVLGLLFTVGMLVADGINGLWVARLLRRADATAALASRMLALTVGSLALAVAAWGLARHLWPAVAGWGEGKELAIGLSVVGAIALGYVWALHRVRLEPPLRA